MKLTFEMIDVSGDGSISVAELQFGLESAKLEVSTTDVTKIFVMFDPDFNGEIDEACVYAILCVIVLCELYLICVVGSSTMLVL